MKLDAKTNYFMFNSILQTLPLRCLLCYQNLDQLCFPWCKTCHYSLPRAFRCLRCGLPFAKEIACCGQCSRQPPLWDNMICAGDYNFPLNSLLHRFKYQKQYWLVSAFANLLKERIIQPAPILLPVPMHWRRQLFHGSNHSELLAQNLAKKLNVECDTHILKREKHTPQQQGLSRISRLSNLKNAFSIRKKPPTHVAIVDDVVTTGATVFELCKLLKNNGVICIDIYCIARNARKDQKAKQS